MSQIPDDAFVVRLPGVPKGISFGRAFNAWRLQQRGRGASPIQGSAIAKGGIGARPVSLDLMREIAAVRRQAQQRFVPQDPQPPLTRGAVQMAIKIERERSNTAGTDPRIIAATSAFRLRV